MTPNEAVLEKPVKALPQVAQIPISLILPNPANPAGPVSPAEAQTMATMLREEGQKTEIRVRPLTEAEKSQNPSFEYLLIGGHVRLEGAKLAGLETLRAIILESRDPAEEELDALLDNRWRDMGWWRWDLAIDRRLKAPNAPSQRKLADQLGFNAAKINRAVKILEVLTPQARDWVSENLSSAGTSEGEGVAPRNTPNKHFSITESQLLVLADLGDPQKVEAALKVALDRKMTEVQAKKLVEWVKAGNEPETYGKSPLSPPLAKGGGGDLGHAVKVHGSTPILKSRVEEAANCEKPMALGETIAVAVHGVKQGAQELKKASASSPSGTPNQTPVLHLADLMEAAGKTLVWVWKNFLLPLSMKLLAFTRQTLFQVIKMVLSQVKSLIKGLWHFLRRSSKKIVGFVFFLALLAFGLSLLADLVFHGNFNFTRAAQGFIGGVEWLVRWVRTFA